MLASETTEVTVKFLDDNEQNHFLFGKSAAAHNKKDPEVIIRPSFYDDAQAFLWSWNNGDQAGITILDYDLRRSYNGGDVYRKIVKTLNPGNVIFIKSAHFNGMDLEDSFLTPTDCTPQIILARWQKMRKEYIERQVETTLRLREIEKRHGRGRNKNYS